MALPEALRHSPQARLLLACAARAPLPADALETVSDWSALREALFFHRLELVFFAGLRGRESLVPSELWHELERRCDIALNNNLFLLAEWTRVLGALRAAGVRTIAYKGPALALSVSHTVAQRAFGDLDLLVAPREEHAARQALGACGYLEATLSTSLSPFLEPLRARDHYETPFALNGDFPVVDAHWSLLAPHEGFPLGFEWLWRRRVSVSPSVDVPTLHPEDLWLALCFHGAKHRWNELDGVACALAVLTQEGANFDWRALEARVARTGCERVLWLGLRLCLDLAASTTGAWGDFVPASLRSRCEEDPLTDAVARAVWRELLGPSQELSSFVRYREKLRFGWRLRRRAGERLRFARGEVRHFVIGSQHSRWARPLTRLAGALQRRSSAGE